MKDLIDHITETARAQNQVLADQARGFYNEPRPLVSNPTPDWGWSIRNLIREIADNAEGFEIHEIKRWNEWRALRALWFRYCNGFEDAYFDAMSQLAVAIRDNDSAWLGSVLLTAWNEYADKPLEAKLRERLQEMAEDAAAVRQGEEVWR